MPARMLKRLRGMPASRTRMYVRVGDNLLSASRIFINVGGRAKVPDMGGANPSDVSELIPTVLGDLKPIV